MIRKGLLESRAAAQLLLAAALIDAVAIFLVVDGLADVVPAVLPPEFGRAVSRLPADLRSLVDVALAIVAFLALLFLYWMVCEVVLGGRTIGRTVLMLEPVGERGGAVKPGQMRQRGLRKIAALGLRGLAIGRQASYDRNAGVAWRSPLAADALRASRDWRITVVSGSDAGRSHAFERLDGWNRDGRIRIGRDPRWADIVLDRDERVSSRHAIISLRDGRLVLTDYGGGKGTRNATRLEGRKLFAGASAPMKVPARFQVADVGLRLHRVTD